MKTNQKGFWAIVSAPLVSSAIARFSVLLLSCLLWSSVGWGQFAVTTNGGSGLATSYASLSAAITALNAATISGPVVITCPTGTETAPLAGYNITATGTSTNTITIQGNGADNSIISAFSPQASGLKTDAIFKIVGGDYITIQGFKMQENASNTTTTVLTNNMTEIGVGLWLTSATNGAQNNTIKNNTITLGSTYQNAIGVFSSSSSSSLNAVLVATATTGTNSSNKFYSNTISNVAYGMYFICEPITATITETGIDIGGSSSATANTITFGFATLSDINLNRFSGVNPAGIYFRNGGFGNNISFNSITSNSLSYAQSSGVYGIMMLGGGTAPIGITYTSTISNNTISLTNTGTTAITGIDFGSGLTTGTLISSNNTITINQTATAANSAAVIGIKANYPSATNTSSSNTIVFNQSNTTGALSSATTGITLAGAGTTLTANSNSVTINQTGSGTATITGAIIGIDYSAAATTINSLSNTVLLNQTTSVASGISNAITGIKATSAATTLNIGSAGNGNTITLKQEITGSGTYGTGAVTYINAASGSATLNIVSNTINNTSSQQRATGTCYAISHNATITSALTVNNNTINLNFGATGPATLYGIYSLSSTALITTYNITNNSVTFTNTVAGSTVYGILNSDGGTTANKVCTGNTFAISGAAVSTNGMTVGYSNAYTISGNTFNLTSSSTSATQLLGINLTTSASGAHSVTNNTFTNLNLTGVLTTAPIVAAIYLLVGNGATIFGNTISNITIGAAGSTGSPSISGVSIAGGTLVSVYKNKIYGISSLCTGATGVVNGILIFGGTTNNVYNNLIGNLTASASTSTDAIRGISITSATTTSTNKVYNNTVYLTGSGGTNFGSSGIYHAASTTATTSTLDLQNNMIFNNCTPSGTGIVTAYRRSAGTTGSLANYASTSNKNLFYAGTPSATNTIMSDGTTNYQTISSFQTAVSTREANSFTESAFTPSTYFVSTTGSDANYLQPASGITTQAEGGGNTITMCSPDFNGVTRPGFSGAAYDVGAWEFAGVSPAPVLTNMTPSPALTSQCTKAARTISIDVTTTSGTITGVTLNYSHNGSVQTAVTMTNSSGNTWTGTMLDPSTGNASVTWSITATNSLGLSTSYTGATYSDEPNTGITATATASPSVVCAGSSASLSVSVAKSGSLSIGSGSTTSFTAGVSFLPGSWGGAKTQYLIRASELTAIGLNAGNITAIGFEPTSAGQTYTGFQLWMNSTSATVLTSTFLGNGTQVYLATGTNNGFLPVANSLNTLSFGTGSGSASSFNWDGTSNLVLTFSWSSVPSASTSTSSTMKVDAISYVCSAYDQTDAVTPAVELATTIGDGTSSSRPKFTFTGNQAPTPTAYSWSDGSSTIGTSNPQSATVSSTTTYTCTATVNSCPMTAAVTPTVNPLPTAPTATPSSQCGAGIPTASVADNNGYSTPTFKWYSAATGGTLLQNSTSVTYTTSINSTTTFYVAVVGTNTCESARTAVTVSVTQPDAISAVTSAAAICLGQSVTLTAANTAATPTQNYSYSWACATSGSGATSANTNNPASITPTAAGSYTYTVTATDGPCSAVNTVAVTVNALPNITSATATPSNVCSGSSISLSANSLGSSLSSAIGNSSGAAISTTGTPYRTGTTLGNQIWNQYLILASELTAAGITTSNINSLGINVSTASPTGTMTSFSIGMANVSDAALTSTLLTNTLTSVFSAASYSPISGINTHTFSSPFLWDGTSNLLIDIKGVLGTSGLGTSLVTSTTPGGIIATVQANSATGFSSTTGTTVSNQRPQFTLGYQSNATSSYSWSWNSTPAIATASGSTTETNTGASATTKTYTVTATNATTGCTNTATTSAVTINPATVAPTATNSSQCGTATPTCSVTGTGNTFAWYTAASGGTALSGQTASSLSSYPVAATTTFYVSENNGTCQSARTPVTVTVTTSPSITASATLSTVCSGSPTVLSVTSSNSGYTYAWDNSLGAGASVTASPTSNTTYTVTATDNSGGAYNSCATTATVAVITNPLPSAISLTPNTTQTICAGNIQSIVASGGSGSLETISTILQEDFNGSVNNWVTTNSSTSGTPSNAAWTLRSNSYVYSTLTFNSNDNSQFYLTNSDAQGSVSTTLTTLTSPAFSTISANSSTLNFYHYFRASDAGKVQYSIDGTNYTTITTYTTTVGAANSFTLATINLPAGALNQPIVYLRFRYEATWDYYWAIDNVTITVSKPNITWSPTTDLYTNAAASTAYTGNPTTVYSKPTANRTYTATATSSNGCTSSASVTLNTSDPLATAPSNGAYVFGVTTNTNYNTAANWYTYSSANGYAIASAVPTSSDVVVIPASGTCVKAQPSLSASASITDVEIQSGAILSLNGNTLSIAGALSGAGTIKGSATSSLSFTGTSSNTLKMDATTAGTTNVLKNLTLSGTGTTTLGNALNITAGANSGSVTAGTGTTLTTGGYLTLKSNASGTARIAQSAGTISGNVTQERFVPGKAIRKWSFLASPVTQSLASAWQQQIHITGAGTGGTMCNNYTISGTMTPHTNGFDVTQLQNPSFYTYDAATDNFVANTTGTTNYTLTPGVGYMVLVRGDRNDATNGGCVLLSANNQAAFTSTSVTLAATGAVGQGTITKVLPVGYSFIGNPYPCEIDFPSFNTTNNSVISGGYWTYYPTNATYTFSTYNNGTSTNGGTQVIANGQSFLVNSTSGGTITFNEAHKSTTANNGNFRLTKTWDELIRVGLSNNQGNRYDEVVVRFANDAAITKAVNEYDAASVNGGDQWIKTLKETSELAIQTRPNTYQNDTVSLAMHAKNAGTYQLGFSEYQGLSNTEVYLIDQQENLIQNVKALPSYEFSVGANTTTANRFKLIFEAKASGVAALATKATLQVYPNPTKDKVRITCNGLEYGAYQIKVRTITGAEVLKAKGTYYQNEVIELSLQDLAAGMYMLELSQDNGFRAIQKITKQ